MIKDEKAVLEYINRKQVVTTLEICEHFGYSESTGRRVINHLTEEGLILRHHGGAASNQVGHQPANVYDRFETNHEQKERIARYAALQVEPGSTVILMGGSTVCEMCRYLKRKHLTIITNSMLVFEEMKNEKGTKLILLGGSFQMNEMEVKGVLTSTNLQHLRAGCIFLGAHNFHPKIGFTTPDIESVEFYRVCFNVADKVFLLADSSKLGTEGAAIMATCEMVDNFITDTGLPDEIVDSFEEQAVHVIRV